MKKLVRYALVSLATVAGAGVLAAGLGLMLPRRHVAVTSAVVSQPAEEVWRAISDMGSQATWRSDLKGVQQLPDHDGRAVWLQQTMTGNWRLEFTEVVEPFRLVAAVVDSSQGFGGTWTYELASVENGTRLTISERGFIDSPLFRFLARFVFGLHASEETYLRDLGRHFGETLTPARED